MKTSKSNQWHMKSFFFSVMNVFEILSAGLIAMTYCQLTVPVCTCYRSKLFLSYSIFKLVHFFQTRSICLNLDQFGAGKKHAGHKSITAHCLPIQEVSLKHSLKLTLGLIIGPIKQKF